MNAPLTVGRIDFAPVPAMPPQSPQAAPHGVSDMSGCIRTGAALSPPAAANDNELAVRPRLIGLMGYGGAGKTTVANILRQQHGFMGNHIKAPLASMARVLLLAAGIRPTDVDYWLDGAGKRQVIPSIGRSGTEIQQFLGTEFGRDFCRDDLWLSLWCRNCDALLSAGRRVVQESVRFSNEADAIRSRGGLVIEVRRPGVGPLPGGHKSEDLPMSADAVINNDGTIGDLYSAIDRIAA